jgi:flagellar biogenesis protein FliO
MENLYLSAIKTVFVLMAMVAGIIIFYRYAGRFKLKLTPQGRAAHKVETIHLGLRKFVSVVEIRERVFVIGVGEKEISLLAQWKKEEKETCE